MEHSYFRKLVKIIILIIALYEKYYFYTNKYPYTIPENENATQNISESNIILVTIYDRTLITPVQFSEIHQSMVNDMHNIHLVWDTVETMLLFIIIYEYSYLINFTLLINVASKIIISTFYQLTNIKLNSIHDLMYSVTQDIIKLDFNHLSKNLQIFFYEEELLALNTVYFILLAILLNVMIAKFIIKVLFGEKKSEKFIQNDLIIKRNVNKKPIKRSDSPSGRRKQESTQ